MNPFCMSPAQGKVRHGGIASLIAVLTASWGLPATAVLASQGDPNTTIYQKLFPGRTAPAAAERPSSPTGPRVLRFPADRPLGRLNVMPADEPRIIRSYFFWTDRGAEWRYLCQARGDVTVPAGQIAQLQIAPDAWRDLSPLASLDPDGLHALTIYGPYQGGAKPTDAITGHIARLTGLRSLTIDHAVITAAGVKNLLALGQLEYLALPESTDDAVMALLPSFAKLKGLYLNNSRLTNAGLAHLKDLPALEELSLGPGRMTDKGLTHLAACSRLEYLMLSGTNFTDFGMAYIKDIPRLKILHAGHLNHLTDRGMENISTAAQVERMSFHWADGITEAGLAHLARLSNLKMLDVSHAQLTDTGTVHLAKLKGIENLEIDGKNLTDIGLTRLAQLTSLRKLSAGRPFFVDPNKDKNYYTDAGVGRLAANCPRLEELAVGSIGMTDASMKAIAGLRHLRNLNLFGVPAVTDAGFSQLRSLESLEYLFYCGRDVTLAGLTALKDLPNFRKLDISKVRRGGVNLDLSGFRRLEELGITLAHKPADTFGDADLAGLADCRSLRWLQIGPRTYSDEGMVYLRNLTEMERLGIGGPMLTDEGLACLAGMKNLNHLSISDGQFTEKALTYLEQLPALCYLFVPQCEAFDGRAQQRLKSRLPNLGTIQIQPRR